MAAHGTAVRTEVQAIKLSPYTPYADADRLGRFAVLRLTPTMLHSPLPFGIFEPVWQG
jgi:hypothetical protein